MIGVSGPAAVVSLLGAVVRSVHSTPRTGNRP